MGNKLIKIIVSNPYMGGIGTLIGLCGIILSIVFYFQSKESRNLIYTVNSARALVVDSKQTSKLQVLYKEKLITSDIIAVQIALWNEGKQSIKQTNILKNIEIKATNSVQLLEISLRKVSRQVINFNIDRDTSNNSIRLIWDILENQDGAVVQLLYAGKLDTQFIIDGIIEGQSEIKQIESDDKKKDIPPIFLLLFGIVMSFVTASMFIKERREKSNLPPENKITFRTKIKKIPDLIFILTPVSFIIIGIYLLITESPSVPFGF